MRAITLTLVVLFYTIVEIHAQFGLPLKIPMGYDNLRLFRPLKNTTEGHTIDEDLKKNHIRVSAQAPSNDCSDSSCPNTTEKSNSSTTNPSSEKMTLLSTIHPFANFSTDKPVDTRGSAIAHVTILPTIHLSENPSTEEPVDIHGSANASVRILPTIHLSDNSSTDKPVDSHATLMPIVHSSSHSSTDETVDINWSTTATAKTETTTELRTTTNSDDDNSFDDLFGGEQKTEIIVSDAELQSRLNKLRMASLEYYDSDESSDEEYDATGVDVALQIQSIADVDEADQKIILDVDLLVHWKDYQLFNESLPSNKIENLTELLLTHGAKRLSDKIFGPIWKPDIFIERVVKISKPSLMSKPYSVRYIEQSASIIFKSRASVKVDCSMNFEYYPADTQNCILDIRSYDNDKTKIELRWNPLPGAFLVNPDTNDNFDLKLSYVAQRKERTRGIILKSLVYDVLQIQLSMRRRLTYHILQTYLPSAFLVIITWLSFLIPEDLIEGRIGISLTTLLTLTAMFSSVRENTPVVSYVRAIDIWMAYCIFTVFSTLLEFTFFVWLRNYKIAQKRNKLESLMVDLENGGANSSEAKIPRTKKLEKMMLNSKEGSTDKSTESKVMRQISHPRDIGVMRQMSLTEIPTMAAEAFERTAQIFNQFALGFFVLSFVVFNVSYWTWLLVYSEHSRWDLNKTLNGGGGDIFGFFGDADRGYDNSNLANHKLLEASGLPVA